MDLWRRRRRRAEAPNHQSNANREAPSLVNVMQVCSRSAPCFIWTCFIPKSLVATGAALLGVQSSVVDSLRVDGDRTVLFQLRIGLQLRCPAVVALAAILLQDPKRCLS
jgi:hypothetical protein